MGPTIGAPVPHPPVPHAVQAQFQQVPAVISRLRCSVAFDALPLQSAAREFGTA